MFRDLFQVASIVLCGVCHKIFGYVRTQRKSSPRRLTPSLRSFLVIHRQRMEHDFQAYFPVFERIHHLLDAHRIQTYPRSKSWHFPCVLPLCLQRCPGTSFPLQIHLCGGFVGLFNLARVRCHPPTIVHASKNWWSRDNHNSLPVRTWNLQGSVHSKLDLQIHCRRSFWSNRGRGWHRPNNPLLRFLLGLLHQVRIIQCGQTKFFTLTNIYRVLQGKSFKLPV